MPLGIGFMGNATSPFGQSNWVLRHKCLSALGSWGTEEWMINNIVADLRHKCLSALGSWGTGGTSPNFGPQPNKSQMPLGIGFMGNPRSSRRVGSHSHRVTNASRHWVHGEQQPTIERNKHERVTNASRHWVHGGNLQ